MLIGPECIKVSGMVTGLRNTPSSPWLYFLPIPLPIFTHWLLPGPALDPLLLRHITWGWCRAAEGKLCHKRPSGARTEARRGMQGNPASHSPGSPPPQGLTVIIGFLQVKAHPYCPVILLHE